MIKRFLTAALLLLSGWISAQTLIATSHHAEATANGNQRKVVRDSNQDVFVIYTDLISDKPILMGLKGNPATGEWGEAVALLPGQNPTLAIGQDDLLHIIFESNDSLRKILYTTTTDLITLESPALLSNPDFDCRLPVADVDSAGNVNVFWIEHQGDDHLMYCRITSASNWIIKTVTSKDTIHDVCIANHLQFMNNDLFFGYSFLTDSIRFFRSTDHLDTWDTLFSTTGIDPGITFNSEHDLFSFSNIVRFLFYRNGIHEVEAYGDDYQGINENQLTNGPSSFLCVDNILPPFGYSYLYISEGTLKHAFSFGPVFQWNEVMGTFGEPGTISHPSVVYKNFNPLFVDFIWMEDNGTDYSIYHARDEKQTGLGLVDPDAGKGFSITGWPNPFSRGLFVEVGTELTGVLPLVEVFNVNSRIVCELRPVQVSENKYAFSWDGKGTHGETVAGGIYLIRCTVGNKRAARKVVFQP